MNKKVMYLAIVSSALMFSIIINGIQYSENKDLENTIQKLTEQDQATQTGKQFVQLLLGDLTDNEEKIREITTTQVQKEIFETPEPQDSYLDEGIQQEVVIDQTYFNRTSSLDRIQVIVQYRIHYQIGSKATIGEYEMSVYLTRHTDGWKVDTYALEKAKDDDLDALSSEQEEVK